MHGFVANKGMLPMELNNSLWYVNTAPGGQRVVKGYCMATATAVSITSGILISTKRMSCDPCLVKVNSPLTLAHRKNPFLAVHNFHFKARFQTWASSPVGAVAEDCMAY